MTDHDMTDQVMTDHDGPAEHSAADRDALAELADELTEAPSPS